MIQAARSSPPWSTADPCAEAARAVAPGVKDADNPRNVANARGHRLPDWNIARDYYMIGHRWRLGWELKTGGTTLARPIVRLLRERQNEREGRL